MSANNVPLVWVDAFCDGPFTGNPAAVCLLEHQPSDDAMQGLAAELGLSETAFVWPDAGNFGLRWFTPAAEVDLCGHATVATAHALAELGRLDRGRARFATKSGWLEAAVEGEEVEIDLPADVPADAAPPSELADRWPVTRAATGRFDLLVELENEEAVRAVDIRDVDLLALPYRGVTVTARAEGPFDYALRFFAPRVGVPEDPVTGSAQCLLGPYWAPRLGTADLRAVQLSARGGVLHVRVGPERVAVAGRAVTILFAEVTGEAARRLLVPAATAT